MMTGIHINIKPGVFSSGNLHTASGSDISGTGTINYYNFAPLICTIVFWSKPPAFYFRSKDNCW